MASQFAKKKLLDIAQGRKKTEQEQRNAMYTPADTPQVRSVLDEAEKKYQADKAQRFMGYAEDAKNFAQRVNPDRVMNTYMKDKPVAEARKSQLVQAGYELYNSPRNTDKRSTMQWQLPSGNGVRDFVPTEEEHAFQRIKNDREGIAAANRVTELESKFPEVKNYRSKLYSIINDNVKTVNPFENSQDYRNRAEQMKAYSAQMGAEQETDRTKMLGTGAETLAQEYTRRADMIDYPLKALKQVNDEIAMLEHAQKTYDVFDRGSDKRDLGKKLEQLYEQKPLLEAKVFRAPDDSWKQNATYAGNVDRYMKGMTEDEYMKLQELSAYEPELAQAYAKAVVERIDHAQQDEGMANLEKYAAENLPVSMYANAMDVLNNVVMKPLTGIATAGAHLLGEEVDEYSYLYFPEKFSAAVTSGTHKAIENNVDTPWVEKALTGGYDIAKGIAENVGRLMVQRGLGMGFIERMGGMFFGAYGGGAYDVAGKDGSNAQQALMGVAAGANEVAWEMLPDKAFNNALDAVSLAKLSGNKRKIADVVKSIFGSFVVDGSGEFMTDISNTAAEHIIMQDDSDINRNAESYVAAGEAESMDEARKMAWKQALMSATYSGIVGALSASATTGSIESIGMIDNAVKNKRRAKLEALAAEEAKAKANDEAEIAAALRPEAPAQEATEEQQAEQSEAEVKAEQAQEAQERQEKPGEIPRKVTVTDDGYTVRKGDQDVNLDDLDDDDLDARVLRKAQDMTADAANDMLQGYQEQEGVSPEEYAKGYKAVYEAGLKGKALKDASGLHAENLTEDQRMRAWVYGTEAKKGNDARVERLTRMNATREGFAARAESGHTGVSFETVTRELSDQETTAMKLLDRFAKQYGLDVRVYETMGDRNASYVVGTNVVKVSLDAQDGAILRAASHELYHYVESWNQEDAKKIRDFVLDKLRNVEEYDLDGRIKEIEAKYRAHGVKDFDAVSEIVADSMLDIIGTEENIRALAQEDRGLLQKIVNFVEKIRRFLKEQIEALTAHNEEAAALYRDEKYMGDIIDMMNKALETAQENYNAKARVGQTAQQNAYVQEYLAGVENAKDAKARGKHLENLTRVMYTETQGDAIRELGDYEGGYQVFTDTLEEFAQGKGALNKLLKDNGLDAAKNEQDMAVLSWLARERQTTENDEEADVVYGNDGEVLAEVIEGAAVKNSLKTWDTEEQEKVYKELRKHGYADHEIKRWMGQVNSVAAIIAADKARLDFESHDNHTMYKKNQEYKYTLDASTLCAKRQLYQGIFDAIQHELPNTVLMPEDLIRLKNKMDEMGLDSPCAICYVESRRRNLGKFAGEWLETYNGAYKPRLDEVTTSDGLEELRVKHPTTYKDFVDAMNKIGTNNPKVVQLRTAYRGEIKKMRPNTVKYLIRIGGMRVQSFSDFEVVHMMDMMQAVIDMAGKHLTAQAYTKVPEFAWVFGSTGMKINLSLIAKGTGLDKNGELIFDDKEGMPFAEAKKLREKYDKNVGTIIVGVSDEHILKCMQDDRIDFIIPFHKSGWSRENMQLMGIGHYEDYTAEQSERYADIGRKVGAKNAIYPKDYWKKELSGKQNAENYLKLCHERGLIPKFPRFLDKNDDGSYSLKADGSTDGYWKLLIDFRMYDKNGKGVDQEEVRPEFNMEKAEEILNNYKGRTENANVMPVNKTVVEEFVEEFKAQHPQESYSIKDDDVMNFFAEITTEEEVRDAGKLINRLDKMRRERHMAPGAWEGNVTAVSKKLLKDTGSKMNQGHLTKKINAMYRAMDNDNATPRELMEYAYDVAELVTEGTGEVIELGDGEKEALKYLKSNRVYLNNAMQSEVRARYGNVGAFMRKNFGKVKFTTQRDTLDKKGRKPSQLEDMWSELCDLAPTYFKADALPSDMPEAVDVFLEATGRVNRNYYGLNEEQIKQDVAMTLFWEYYQMPGTYSHLNNKQQEMLQELSDMQDSLRDSYNERVRNRVNKIIEGKERAEKRERMRNDIARRYTALWKRYNHPTKENHIYEELRPAVKALMDIIQSDGNGDVSEKYLKLKGILAGLAANNEEAALNINGGIYMDDGALDELALYAKGKTNGNWQRMPGDVLEIMHDVVTNIHYAVTSADKLMTEGHKGSVRQIALKLHDAMKEHEDRKAKSDLGNTIKSINYTLMDAPRFFREFARFGGEGAKDLWQIVRYNGQDTQIRNLEEARALFAEKIGKYDYEKWTGAKAEKHAVKTQQGTIYVSTGQLMNLYALNQREQAENHLYGRVGADGVVRGGGIMATRIKTKDGWLEGVKPSQVTRDQLAEAFRQLTAEQKACANALVEIMSTWCAQKGNETSRAMYGFDMYKEKHYIPITVWGGRKNFTQEEQNTGNMYRLMNKGWTKKLVAEASEPLLVGDIFDVTAKHVNEVINYNAWAGPMADLIRVMNYKGRELMTWDDQMKDVVRWFDEDWKESDTIRGDIERTMGSDAFKWLEQLVKDTNGLVVNKAESTIEKLVGAGLRNSKASSVLFNLGTAMKQPTSIVRAMNVIPAHYFVGKIELNKEKLELMREYAPIARWKDWGFFTMDTGRSTESVLLPKKRKMNETVSDAGMYLAGQGDTVTWMNIWAAAERMVKAKNKNLEVGSDAYYKQVAKVFSDCIDRTQTVDSILHRSELLRQKTLGVKMITTFMGEPLKQYNELMDAYLEYKHGNSEKAKWALVKGTAQFARAALVAGMVDALVSALRNMDDDPFWEQWLEKLVGTYDEDMKIGERAGEFIFSSLGNQLNVLNYVPIARDWVEQMQGYDVTRADMGVLDAFMSAAKGIFDEKKSMTSRVTTLLGALGDVAGIGTGNIIKEAKRVWNFVNVAAEKMGANTIHMQYALLKWNKRIRQENVNDYATFIGKARSMGYDEYADDIRADLIAKGIDEENLDTKTSDKIVQDATGMDKVTLEKTYAALGEAIRSGDKELQKLLTKELERKGKDADAINDGLISWLKQDADVIAAAEKAVAGDEKAKANMYKELQKQGFSEEVSKAAVNRAYNAVYSGSYKKENKADEEKEKTVEPLYGYNDLHVAVEDGDRSGAQEIIADLRKAGKSDSSIKSALTSRIKPIYIALAKGSATDKKQAKQIKQMLMSLDLENKYTEKAIDGWLE